MQKGKAGTTKASPLKVFQAQFGFYDSVVAAPSQPAALRAWGTHQNLFAAGRATRTMDAAAIEAALAHPNVPLRRALGSNGAFEADPTSRPVLPDMPRRRPAAHATGEAKAKVRPKAAADRSGLDAAERAVAVLDAGRKQQEVEFETRRSNLQSEIKEARTTYQARRKAALAAVAAAREAYKRAGGGD